MKVIVEKIMYLIFTVIIAVISLISATSFALTVGDIYTNKEGWKANLNGQIQLPHLTKLNFQNDDRLSVSPDNSIVMPTASFNFNNGSEVMIGFKKSPPGPPPGAYEGEFEKFYKNVDGKLQEVKLNQPFSCNAFCSVPVLSGQSITFAAGSVFHLSFENYSEIKDGELFILGSGFLTIDHGVLTDLPADLILAIDQDGKKFAVMRQSINPQ